jgi:hypothetical protein
MWNSNCWRRVRADIPYRMPTRVSCEAAARLPPATHTVLWCIAVPSEWEPAAQSCVKIGCECQPTRRKARSVWVPESDWAAAGSGSA